MQKRLLLTSLLFSFLLLARGNETATEARALSGKCDHRSHGAAVQQDPYAGLDPIQQRLLSNLAEQHAKRKPLALCFAPGTPQEEIRKSNQKLKVAAFRVAEDARWDQTATQGSGIPRGVPVTLRWSFLPDGVNIDNHSGNDTEISAPSNLKAFLNGIYGNEAAWFGLFQQVFDRWSELSGVNYVYESNDDGALFPDSPGVVGVRGDVRIGGHFIDGPSKILAYNFFPTTGDMVIDTADTFFNNINNGSLGLRNVLAHEAGHGLGFDHVCPLEQKKLMEPFVSFAFSGPQHDDILAVQRNYGDNYGQITTPATAADLGAFDNHILTITNVSIDGTGELDFFKFSLPGTRKLASVTLAPVGQTYLEGEQEEDGDCSPGTLFNSKSIANLSLQLIDANGTTMLGSANVNPAGQNETLTNILLTGTGPYFIRIAGDSTDNVQLYEFTLTIADAPLPAPVIVAEPAFTPGTSNTISWNTIQAINGSEQQPMEGVSGGRRVVDSGTLTAKNKNILPARGTRPRTGSSIQVSTAQKGSSVVAPIFQSIFSENFEGIFPGQWDLYYGPDADVTWLDSNYASHGGNWSGWCAGTLGISPANGYVDNMHGWLVYGPFSLADAASARVKFWFMNNSELNADYLKWWASTNDLDYYGFKISGNQDWTSETFDLTNVEELGNLAGQPQVWIAFVFESDFSISGAEGYIGAFLDDIVIEKDVSTPADLTPYKPANWSDKLPIGITQLGVNDAHTFAGIFYDDQTLYLNWASFNQGAVAASNYTVRIEVTGTGGGVWTSTVTNTPANGWSGSPLDQPIGPLAAGQHTVKVWVDYDNTVSESNEANNYYERTIYVSTVAPVEYYAEISTNSGFTSPFGSGWITGTQYTFSNLQGGQTYWYRVKARHGANVSDWSASVSSQQEGAPVLSVGPLGSAHFGTINVGGTADRTFFLTNSGLGTLSGSASAAAPFSIFSGGSYNLAAGQSHSVVVRYSPTNAAIHNGIISFSGGGGASRQLFGVATNGNSAPTVVITLPTSSSTYNTNGNSISLAGTASDDVAISSVTWSNNRGGSGSAVGTTNWSIPAISLQPGTNLLTVTAQDAASASGSDTLSVVFIPANIFHSIIKTNGHFRFTLDGEVGRTYVVQYSSNLVSWPTLVTLTNTSGSVIYTDLNATNGARFYRAFPQ